MDIRARVLWFAANWRLYRDKPFILAITGSIAKTSTKEAIGAVLRQAYGSHQVRVGFGNLNTELGLPLAILGYRIDFHTQHITWQWPFLLAGVLWQGFFSRLPRFLVLEMGADQPGDLVKLTTHIKPNVGIVTLIGEAHLANYHSQADLAQEKSEILQAVRRDGVAVINRRDPFRDFLVKQSVAPVVEFDCPTMDIAQTIARTVAEQMKIDPEVTGQALATSWQPAGRLDIHEGTYRIIDDSYNASPTSMEAALEKLSRMSGRKVAVLGSMLELGQNEIQFHDAIGRKARQVADLVIGVGELAKHYQPDHWFATSDEAKDRVVAFLAKGDSILVKGSHGIRTDKIAEVLK